MKPRMLTGLFLSIVILLAIAISACGPAGSNVTQPATVAPQPNALTSVRVGVPPHLDGSGDDMAWQVAPARTLEATGDGVKSFQVTLKSVYDDKNVYLLVQYPDVNMQVIRSPWTYDAVSKSWVQISDTYGDEDEFGFYWNVNAPNYQVNGCQDFCHKEDPNNQRMYTPPGTWVDIWQFNGARSAPMGWMRDMRLTDNPDASESGGFVEDEGFTTNPGYADNVQTLSGVALPLYWKPFSGAGGIVAGDPIYLLQSEIDAGYARKIVGANADGTLDDEDGSIISVTTRIPGRILSAPAGPSWNDIKARGNWIDGVWTVEIAHPLRTGHADDIQFDTTQEYYFDIYFKTRVVGEQDREIVTVSKFVFGQ
jgi:hypothetical protein